MIRASAGTAKVLGFNNIRMETPPTCAYLMLGSRCQGVCKFCAQSSLSKDSNFLSRITWKPKEDKEIYKALDISFKDGLLKRACFQVVQKEDSLKKTLKAVKELRKYSNIPISVSINGVTLEDMAELFNAGTENIAISFDAVTADLFEEIKGRSWKNQWNLYEKAVKMFHRKIVVHIIVGLGEKEEDLYEILLRFHYNKTPVSLFAFTPLPNTPFSHKKPPLLSLYRKIQIIHYLIRKNYIDKIKEIIDISKGNIKFKKGSLEYLINKIPKKAFMTFGCNNCNRPLYNERPRQTPYNYPRLLTEEERIEAIKKIFC